MEIDLTLGDWRLTGRIDQLFDDDPSIVKLTGRLNKRERDDVVLYLETWANKLENAPG